MKILSCMFGRKKGGIERVFLDYEQAFLDLGYNSSVLANSAFEDIKRIKSKELYKTTHNSVYNPLSYYHVIKCINQHNPDLIFLHGNRAIDLVCNKIVKLFIKDKNVNFIATTHNARNKRFIKLDYAIAISEELKQNLICRGIDKNTIFKCSNATTLQKEDKAFKYHKTPVIGAMGRLHPVKGYDILLKSFAELLKSGTKAKLVLAGAGDEKNNLEKLIKELNIEKDVEMLSWVDNPSDFFKKIDVFCLSSRSEGMPLSLLEAMSFSKPCVSTDCPGAVEVINHNSAGIVVKREDISDLAQGLKKLVSNEKLGKELSKKSYKTIKDFYSKKVMEKTLKDIIEKISR